MAKKHFEHDEEKALKEAFNKSISRGKMFNINTWKKKREKERINYNILMSQIKI